MCNPLVVTHGPFQQQYLVITVSRLDISVQAALGPLPDFLLTSPISAAIYLDEPFRTRISTLLNHKITAKLSNRSLVWNFPQSFSFYR
jgi:hypothetical protein